MRPPDPAPSPLDGSFVLSVPVGDADAVERQLREAGVAIAAPASDKPWGWRSLHVVDPAGVVLDLFHVANTDPTP